MTQLIATLALDHDPWRVMLALGTGILGAFALVQMVEQARGTAALPRLGWLFLTALGGGATIAPAGMVSLLAATAATVPGLAIVAGRRSVPRGAAGGVLVGAAIAALPAAELPLAQSVLPGLLTVAAAAAAFAALACRWLRRSRLPLAAGLLAVAFVGPPLLGNAALPIDASRGPPVGVPVVAAAFVWAYLDRQARAESLHRLRQLAHNDPLTGLPNRASFEEQLERRVAAARQAGTRLAVIAIDLERFTEVNDRHGHRVGNAALARLADRLRRQVDGEGSVARVGGDEFAVLVAPRDHAALAALAGRLQEALEMPLALGASSLRIGASLGVAVFPEDAADADTLASNADLAMYRAKRAGSLAPCFFDIALEQAVRERRDLAADLRQALADDALELHYQVQAAVGSGAVTGYEALLRWRHPLHGAVPPDRFVAVAEEFGLMPALGEWVLRRACDDARTWPQPVRIAVNVSALQLADPGLPALVAEVLRQTGLPAQRLEVELTETAIMADRVRALAVLRAIKDLGVAVALDDFGTGYSSLETLRGFPFDKIKLDRSFVSGLTDSAPALAILRAVLALGRSLAVPVLAEGVETAAQLAVLRAEGCDEAQGYLLGRPAPRPQLKARPATAPLPVPLLAAAG